MKILFDWWMNRRARKLARRLEPWLKSGARTADIGSGTGHNAQTWRKQFGLVVDEYDIADLHWIGPGPVLFDGLRLPRGETRYEAMTVLYVLQYAHDPASLLKQLAEKCSGPILLIQSTYRGIWGRSFLELREWITGRLALQLARRAGILGGDACPLIPRRLFSRVDLARTVQEAGLIIDTWQPSELWGFATSRDLYVLRSTPRCPTSRSLSPHGMKNVG